MVVRQTRGLSEIKNLADAPYDEIDEWFLEEMGKLESGVCFALRLLQLLPGPPDLEDLAWSIKELLMES